jgi:hypothetical protein
MLLLAALPQAAPVQAASGSVEPPAGPPGTTFTFRASGFNSSEQMGVWLIQPDGSNRRLGDEVSDVRKFADEEGNLEWTWTPDSLAPGGEWEAVARGDVSRVTVSIPFTVQNDIGSQPPTSWFVEPPAGTAGTTFTFVGRSSGFIPGEQVGSWFIQPNGEPFNVDQGMSVDPNGQIFRIWQAPEGAYGGEWIFRAVGVSSRYNIDMPFYIEGPPPPPKPQVPLEVTPGSGPPGTTFSLLAGGYQPGEIVSNWLVRPDGEALDAAVYTTANGNGFVTWEWFSPGDAPGGVWEWWLRGTQTGGRQHVKFVVEGNNPIPPPPSIPPGSVSPTSGPPDTPFYFSAEGFAPREYVFFWPEAPDGTPVQNAKEARADTEGNVVWRWDAPYDADPGQWMMSARGKISTTRVQIPFTVTSDEPPQQTTSAEPAYGSAGTTFNFVALGYRSGEFVDIWVDGPEGQRFDIPTTTASREGRVEWSWEAPATIRTGRWQSVALGRDSRLRQAIEFIVSESAGPVQPYGVDPYSGPPGTTFNFYAEGYPSNELVGYWLTDPEGNPVRTMHMPDKDSDQTHANQDGRVEISWDSPPDAPRGVWNLTMRTVRPDELETDITYTIRFIIE